MNSSVQNINDLITLQHNRFFFTRMLANVNTPEIGDYKCSAKNNDFIGWLKCDGRSVSRTVYADLFNIIGTSFGSDDSQTFKLPDFRGKVFGAIGTDGSSGITLRNLGDKIGEETHLLTQQELPSHTHTGTTDASGSHTHTTNATGNVGLVITDGNNTAINVDSTVNELNLHRNPIDLTINQSGSHTHTFTTNATGGGQRFNVMQPSLFGGNVFIYGGWTKKF